jgi:integrase
LSNKSANIHHFSASLKFIQRLMTFLRKLDTNQSRRLKMRGHITKRGKASWTLVVYLGRDPQTGKKRYHWQSVKGTKQRAEKELAAIINNLESGLYVKPTKTTLAAFLEQWLHDYVSTNTAPKTSERYAQIVRLHLIPNLGSIPLIQLRPEHLQSYYASALANGRINGNGGLSAQTVTHHHRLLSEALNHAVKWGIIARNIATAVDPPRPEKKEITTLAPDDFPLLLAEAQKLERSSEFPYYIFFFTALHTGMRRGELLALRWCDIDLDLANIYVNRSLQSLRGGSLVFREPKTPRARRLVAMTPSLAIELSKHKGSQAAMRLLFGKTLQHDDLLFCHPDGSPINPNTVSPAFAKIARRAGLTLRLHDLRHTHATLMLKSGVHPKIVSERLGHATVAFTLDTYSHVVPGLQEAAAKAFDEVLNIDKGIIPVVTED